MRRILLRPEGDQGAYAILYAITLMLFLAFAGLVVDINSARADRRINRLAADSAALAAATELRSDGPNALQACTKAAAYLDDNIPNLAVDPITLCSPFALFAEGPWTCPPAAVPFVPYASGDYRIVMTWPVVDGSPLLVNPDVRPGNYTQTEDAQFDGVEPCQRFGVSVSLKRSFVFGPAIGGPSGTTTAASSVGRAAPEGESGDLAVALILLEREGCAVLSLPNTGPSVIVEGNGDKPGGIQADSLGRASDPTCAKNKIFDVQQNDPARVIAEHAETVAPSALSPAQGIIGSAALTGASGADSTSVYSGDPGYRVRAKAAPAEPTVPLAQQVPTARSVVTRGVVDRRYRASVIDRIASATSAWQPFPGNPCSEGLLERCVLELGSSCNLGTGVNMNVDVVVRCTGAVSNQKITAADFTFTGLQSTITFDRSIDVGSGKLLHLADPKRVFVNGDISNQGALLVNNSLNPALTCAERQSTAPTSTAVLVLAGGLTSTGTGAQTNLCATTVIFATCPVPTSNGTAPVSNTCTDRLDATGGTFDWSGPDAAVGKPTADDFANLEDLALWGEASGFSGGAGNGKHRLNGGVTMILRGVYFLPNANAFELGGNGTQKVRDAQMVVRRLEVSGSATFAFRPDPDDVVTIPFYGAVTLIR